MVNMDVDKDNNAEEDVGSTSFMNIKDMVIVAVADTVYSNTMYYLCFRGRYKLTKHMT